MAVICIDAGTTMIKAVGYDERGTEVVVVRQATTVSRPQPGWAEQDMDVGLGRRGLHRPRRRPRAREPTWTTSRSPLRATAAGSSTPAAPRPGPAILWNDGRAADIIEDWTRSGVLDQAFRINGSLTSSGLPNAILTWLHRYDPDRLERSALSLTCGGWVFAQMTGHLGIDESDAAAPFLDIRSRRYSPELLGLYDMEWAQRLLPEIRGDDRRIAELTSAAAVQLGLPAGTPVVLSSYDIASTAIGVGAVSGGQACSILGTTLCTEVVTEEVEPRRGRRRADRGARAAGEVPAGLPDLRRRRGDPVGLSAARAGRPVRAGRARHPVRPGAGGLTFLPYLSPAGERAPFLNPLARGAFLGLSFEHQREHVARAVLEGLTLVIQDCLAASRAKPSELRVCGGGAASPVWLQLIADVTGHARAALDGHRGGRQGGVPARPGRAPGARPGGGRRTAVRPHPRHLRSRIRPGPPCTPTCTRTSSPCGRPPRRRGRGWRRCGTAQSTSPLPAPSRPSRRERSNAALPSSPSAAAAPRAPADPAGAPRDRRSWRVRRGVGRARPRHPERPGPGRHRRRHVVGTGTQKLTSRRDGPRHEQDPEQWWQAVAAACREALHDVDAGQRARGGGRRHLRHRPARRPPTAPR